jgi:CDP-diacylglycerol--glycerol-3-phosphate 3-phosphatidyltransferase
MKLDPASDDSRRNREGRPLGAPPRRRDDPWNVPNLLSALRLAGSPLLIVLAAARLPTAFFVWFAVLVLSDWLDGKLATRLKQATTRGARLDSLADATFYGCVLVSMLWLRWGIIRQETLWIGLAIASYLLSLTVGFLRFRRLPSYHTRMAKTSWLFVSIAVVSLVARWPAWPLRIALIMVLVTNLEAAAISLVLKRWRVNVPSLIHALRSRPPGE